MFRIISLVSIFVLGGCSNYTGKADLDKSYEVCSVNGGLRGVITDSISVYVKCKNNAEFKLSKGKLRDGRLI